MEMGKSRWPTRYYPQVRFVSLVESGTHVLFGTQMSGYGDGEITLAHKVLPASALRVLGGKRNARIVRHANERLWTSGNHAGPQGITRKCASCPWWKAGRTYCSARK